MVAKEKNKPVKSNSVKKGAVSKSKKETIPTVIKTKQPKKQVKKIINETQETIQQPILIQESIQEPIQEPIQEQDGIQISFDDEYLEESSEETNDIDLNEESIEQIKDIDEDDESTQQDPNTSIDDQDLTLLNHLDSSDDEGDVFQSNKPSISLDNAKDVINEKIKTLVPKNIKTPATLYIGRVPHGFYEKQMAAYFSQFGKVLRLRISRNKKTGKSKHYAFIEFESQDVAQIVCETMDNYLIMGHILKCKIIPNEQIHPSLFHGANRRFKVIPWNKIQREKQNEPKTPEQLVKCHNRAIKKEQAKIEKLKSIGIHYDFPGVSNKVK